LLLRVFYICVAGSGLTNFPCGDQEKKVGRRVGRPWKLLYKCTCICVAGIWFWGCTPALDRDMVWRKGAASWWLWLGLLMVH
jgi:hypothetical protein